MVADELATPDSFHGALLDALRVEAGVPDLEYVRAPSRIPSGHETDVYALELRRGPPELDGPLIARCFTKTGEPRSASFEAAVHDGLHDLGFPVPRVLIARDAPPAFLLMERLPGRSIADGLEIEEGRVDRLLALGALLRISLGLPKLLGEVTGRLLALDSEPVLRALQARGLAPAAIGFERHLKDFAERVDEQALTGHVEALRWLQRAGPPGCERLAICHGDLAPNLLVDGARWSGVIDWSAAFVTLADPAFEIANTRVMIQVPLPFPAPFRRASAAYQRGLVRQYARALGAQWAPSPERLRYYEAWRLFRTLLGAAELWRACAEGEPFPERPDPWCLPEVASQVAAHFRARTGVRITLPDPPRRTAR
jgi:aminoglycoside phosphotransferase